MSQRSVKNIQFCCHKRRWETSRCLPDLFSWTSCEKQAVLFLLTRLETSISSKFSWKMSHLNQVCCWKCSSSLSKISEYFTTNTAGKCLHVSSKTSSGFRLMNAETLSEQRSLTIISPSTLKSSYKHVRLIRHVLQDHTCKTQLNFVFRTN